MMHKFFNNDLKFLMWAPLVVAALLFGYGSALFSALCLTRAESLMRGHVAGFAIFTSVVTLLLLIMLYAASLHYQGYRNRLRWRILLLLLNIPISILYVFIYLKLIFPEKP